jgi:hypothetical protein
MAADLDRRLLEALIRWFESEWTFEHVAFFAQKAQERQIRLFEEMGLRFLYTLQPRQAFLGEAMAYLVEPIA